MSDYRAPGAQWTTELLGQPSGQAASWTVALLNADTDAVAIAATNTGVSETSAPSGNYKKTFTLPTTAGVYKAQWVKGSLKLLDQDEVEVTYSSVAASVVPGAPYFTVAEFRARYPDITSSVKTDQEIEDARALAEEAFEHACEVAFVPRTVTGEKVSGIGSGSLVLQWPRIRSVTAVSVDGTAFTSDQLALLQFGAGSVVSYGWRTPGWFCRGIGNVTVSYEHGYDSPPLRVKQAVMMLTREWLVQGPVSDRAIQEISPGDGGTINLLTPGLRGSVFGLPEVDVTVAQYSERTYVG
jgi:hypothetical protein